MVMQCLHKMEKLRKRYRTKIQWARSMPVLRFVSSWVHFKHMNPMEKGPNVKPDYHSDSSDEENDEDDQDQDFYEDKGKPQPQVRGGERERCDVRDGSSYKGIRRWVCEDGADEDGDGKGDRDDEDEYGDEENRNE
ncbi:hypothetical protein PTKIN_Ptkin12aG0210800 [Pterospermum kingtungense]